MAVFVFLVILILFFGILSSMSTPEKGKRLSRNAELITKALTGRSDQSILEENKVDKEKVSEFVETPTTYEDIKKDLGLKGDFCIYFEDSNGNLIPFMVDDKETLDPSDDEYINGLGSENAVINSQKCGQKYTK